MVTSGTLLEDWAKTEDLADLLTDTAVVVKLWFCEPFTAVTSVDNSICSGVDC